MLIFIIATNSRVILSQELKKGFLNMKTIKKLVATALLLTSTITAFANDYALLNTYPLLNDMKVAQQQQALLNNMRTAISDKKNNNKKVLSSLKSQFSITISGLSDGNHVLNLKGTKIVTIKNKIEAIKLLWSQESHMLDSAINNKMYKNEAFQTIDKLSNNLKVLNKLYTQSHARYKQNSIMKSLVTNYMKSQTPAEPKYAYNTVR